MSTLQKCRPGISTMSLGYASAHHKLPYKLSQAALHGFQGVEIFYDDLEAYAQDTYGSTSRTHLLRAASSIHADMCNPLGLKVICLQPFRGYEGLIDRIEHAQRLDELRFWIMLAKALDTDLIAFASSFLGPDRCSSDTGLIVKDFQEAADICHVQDIRVSFEALCWGTYIDTWESSWGIVQAVNRVNFGLCLDTFNIAGRVFADPTLPGCRRANGQEELTTSMERLVNTVDPSRIFYVQVVDAEPLARPLIDAGHPYYSASQPARMSWSRNCRVFYGEGYMPVREVVRAILEGLQYQGWISMELFNRSCTSEGKSNVGDHARRGKESWEAMRQDFDIAGCATPCQSCSLSSSGDSHKISHGYRLLSTLQ